MRYLEHVDVIHRVAWSGTWRVHRRSSATPGTPRRPAAAPPAPPTPPTGSRALGDPGFPAARRITDMADSFRFLHRRIPELLDEWSALHPATTERT
ncbi:hypothetical protein GCM10009836_04070 [Pseudonocardia ailaonensis]|uniref:Uncharacterized protein n=1 Tax=Pseudonocardia ailaonensis TaxID=367279 RepID=A0ABN2MJW2_9PSEU